MKNTYYKDEEVKSPFKISSFAQVLKYVYKFKLTFIGIAVSLLTSAILALVGPYIIEQITDVVVPNKDYEYLFKLLLAFIGIALLDIGITFVNTFFTGTVGQKIVYLIRKDVFNNLMNLSFDFFDNRPAGKIVVRVTNYVDSVATFFSVTFLNTVIAIIKIFVILGYMFYLNYILALVVIAMLIPLIIVINLFRKKMAKQQKVIKAKSSNRSAFLVESIMGVKEIKSFNRLEFNENIYKDLQFSVANPWIKYIKILEANGMTFEILWNVGVIALYFVSFLLVKNGQLLPGVLIQFITYLGVIYGPISTLINAFSQLSESTTYLELILEIKNAIPTIKDKDNAISLQNVEGKVDFKDVTFAYDEGENVLEHFNLSVKPGENIALVGATGCGKTTIVSMLTRFFDVQNGCVCVDDIDVKDIKILSLRQQVGVVMQDPFMFKGTVIDNIRYGKENATDEECINAAKEIKADSFISRLPNGYYTELGENGRGLSSGEKQLISFARIVLKNPKIFIFDEATSSIDSETEELIQHSLEHIIKGRTSFFVAHRLSTIKKSDRILFIGDKGIKEQGSFDELMDKKGYFYNLEKS